MQAYGLSKHIDQQKTNQERNLLKSQGVPYKERLNINYCKNYIYSYNTMTLYQKKVEKFAEYLTSIGKKKITIEESKDYIQNYINYLKDEKKLAPTSIHTELAAICKATHTNMLDYEHPRRSIAEITKGTKLLELENITNPNTLETLIANGLLGLRRNELMNLKAKDIIEHDNKVIVNTVGKGGKHNQQIFIWEDEMKAVLKLKEDKGENDFIFPKEYFNNNANYHKMRELRAKEVYYRVCKDIETRGLEAKLEYQEYIRTIFKVNGKILRENLDHPVYVRSANRNRLEKSDREISWDRTALMYVSVTVTNHFRTNVTLSHYVGK